MVLGFVGVGGRHGKSNLKRRRPTTNGVIWDFFPCGTIFNHCTDSIAVITFFATVCQFGNWKLDGYTKIQNNPYKQVYGVHDDEIQQRSWFLA